MEKTFRCPFELKGIHDGTIIEHELPKRQAQRFELLRTLLERFHRAHRWSAIRLIVPQHIWNDCTSNEKLRSIILPYQAELIAAILDDQLFPLLPHHDTARQMLENLGLALPFPRKPAELLRKFFGADAPTSMSQLSDRLVELFCAGVNYEIQERTQDSDLTYVLLSLGTVQISGDNAKNLFTIVKTPFYPRAFGRYSERVEIVLTRHHDIDQLSNRTKRRIRQDANTIHRAHGIPIVDPDAEQQTAGLWIPGEAAEIRVIE